MSQLLSTIHDFERSLNDELPRELFSTRRNSSCLSKDHIERKAHRHRPKLLPLRSISPIDPTTTSPECKTEPSCAILNRFPRVLMDHLGPGYYNLDIKPTTRKQSFSPVPRFNTLDEGLRSIHKSSVTPQGKSTVTARTRKHISAIDDFKPHNFRLKIQEKALKEEFRMNVTKLARKEIEEQEKKRHLEDLKEKFRRHEWRLRGLEISACKRRWSALFFYISSVTFWAHKQVWRKQLHLRSQKVLKFLLLVSLAIGKITHTLRKRRIHRAMMVLRKLAPIVGKWLKKRKETMREKIAETVERSLSNAVFYQIIASWKRRIVQIQRSVKRWLVRRGVLKRFLLEQWNSQEPQIRRVAEGVPEPVKVHYLNSFFKAKLQEHLMDLENWRARCEIVQEHYQKLLYESLDDPPPKPIMPKKPFLSIVLTAEDVSGLTAKAEKKKYHWQRIVKATRPHRKESLIESEGAL